MPTLVFEAEGDGPHPGLVIAQHLPVAHEGLEKDPFTIDVGERYAAAGYVCVIPFLFHWWPPDEELAVKFKEFRDDWTVADLAAARGLLAAEPGVDEHRTGILGHCWGGRVAWLGACHDPDFRACGVFYGGRIKASMADGAPPPIELADRIRCPVLGIFGNDDKGPSPDDVDDYERALVANGVPCEFHRYDGAGHGFQDFSNADRYCSEQSDDAWTKSLAFFGEHL
jgi:carboxymethylenebutenolidase